MDDGGIAFPHIISLLSAGATLELPLAQSPFPLSTCASLGSCGIGAEQSSIGEAEGLSKGCRGGFGSVST